jgi:hypothetical protein
MAEFDKLLLKDRTPEQQSVIKYFRKPEGCFSKNISDGDYDKLVQDKLAGLNLKQKALDKIGVDESQVKEVEPAEFKNWYFGEKGGKSDKNIWVKRGKDGKFRTTAFQVSWLFFSDKQVYAYQYTLHMNEDSKKERTEEYFYRDITNFTTVSESEQKEYRRIGKGCLVKKLEVEHQNVDYERFAISVGGERFLCEMINDDDATSRVQAMKAKLREKKG